MAVVQLEETFAFKNAPFTELRRAVQEAAKTELFEARAARHYARQHAGPTGRNLTDLNLPLQRANYVCSANNGRSILDLTKLGAHGCLG